MLGHHRGIGAYTIGQRKGLNLAMGHPVFVTGINPEENKIIIGENDELFQRALYASNVNLMSRASLDEPGAPDGQDTLRPQSSTVHSQTVAGRKFICMF